MKISVIIPVFNAQKYLKECLDSLMKQTYLNMEFIIVDDGSTDDSLKICKTYQKKDSRFRVFSKKNGGTSSARNYGLKKVTGNYVTFVDNDDYINDKNAFFNVIEVLEKNNPDIIFHDCIYYWEDKKKYIFPKIKFDNNLLNDTSKNDSLSYLISSGVYSYTVWDKIYKYSIIKDNDIFFAEGMRNEDADFNIRFLMYAKKFLYSNNSFYVYRKATSYAQTSVLKYKDTLDLKNILEKYLNDKYDSDFEICLFNYLAYLYAVYIAQVTLLKCNDAKEDLKYMKKYKFLFKYNLNPNVKKISIIYNYLGFDIVRFILSKYILIKFRLKMID